MTSALIIDGPTAITESWLGDALMSSGIGVTVRSVRVTPLGTGQVASAFRIHADYADGEGPPRLVVKLPSGDPEVRARHAMPYRTEARFYSDLASKLRLPVPRCYFAGISDDGLSFTLLLEDMAPAVPGDQLAGCSAEQALAAALTVAQLHACTWCDPSLDHIDWLIPRSAEILQVLAGLARDATSSFVDSYDIDAGTAAVFTEFAEYVIPWLTDRRGPFALVHNDYRLDNLLFDTVDAHVARVTAVDWQSLTVGAPLRDVAYLLGTGMLPAERRIRERGIVDSYHHALLEAGVRHYGAEQCWEDYRRAQLQGPLISILGAAFSMPTDRSRPMFCAMAQRSAAAIRDLESFALIDHT